MSYVCVRWVKGPFFVIIIQKHTFSRCLIFYQPWNKVLIASVFDAVIQIVQPKHSLKISRYLLVITTTAIISRIFIIIVSVNKGLISFYTSKVNTI